MGGSLRALFTLSMAAAFPLLFVGGPAIAEMACPPRVTPDQPRVTATPIYKGGIPLDQPILIENDDKLYRVPAGYLSRWPTTAKTVMGEKIPGTNFSGVNKRHILGFTFWMPSRRHAEIEPDSVPSFRPCEPGRPNPRSDEYQVDVNAQPLNWSHVQGLLTPSKKFENWVGRRSMKEARSAYWVREEHGLLRFQHRTARSPSLYYRHLENTVPEVLFSCRVSSGMVPNAGCDGFVLFPDDDLHFHLHFPYDALPHWRSIAETARDFLREWQVEPRPLDSHKDDKR